MLRGHNIRDRYNVRLKTSLTGGGVYTGHNNYRQEWLLLKTPKVVTLREVIFHAGKQFNRVVNWIKIAF